MHIGIISNLLQQNTINNNKSLTNSLEKLSAGLRINKASDDASGLAISDKLRTQASGIKQGIENANSAIAMMNIADKAISEMSNILDTIKTKAIQMNTDTTSEDGRVLIKNDILKLIDSYDKIACSTNYNRTPLLTGCASPFDFQVGNNANDLISVEIDNIQARQMGQADPYKLKNFITGFNAMPIAPEPPTTNFENNNFNNGSQGWIVTNNVARAGITNIAGFPMPLDSTYPSNTTNNEDTIGTMTYTTTFSTGKVTLSSSGSSNHGFDVIRGPYLESEKAISISKDATVTVSWDAEGGYDAYDVFGYLIDVNTGESQIIMNETSSSTSGTTTKDSVITINKDGKYKFVFVSGSYDLTGGQALGATLNINKIVVDGNSSSIPIEETPTDEKCACDSLNLVRNDDNPNLKTQAQILMDVVDASLSQLNSQRANVGAGTNQLESSARNNLTGYVNLKNAESIIRDVDYAQESANFNKSNIIAQAGSFVLSQASQVEKNWVAQLLK